MPQIIDDKSILVSRMNLIQNKTKKFGNLNNLFTKIETKQKLYSNLYLIFTPHKFGIGSQKEKKKDKFA